MDPMTYSCPDCSAELPTTAHEATCPLLQRLEQVRADDREWFTAYTGPRVRRLGPAEMSLLRAAGANEGKPWVAVWQLAPGVRAYSYDGWTAA